MRQQDQIQDQVGQELRVDVRKYPEKEDQHVESIPNKLITSSYLLMYDKNI